MTYFPPRRDDAAPRKSPGPKAEASVDHERLQYTENPNPGAMCAAHWNAFNATSAAMLMLRAAGEPGHASPGQVADGLAIVLRARLGPCERLLLASAGMLSLDQDKAEALALATLAQVRAGEPIPAFTTVEAEARDWADMATLSELRAYAAASWHRLPPSEQSQFAKLAQRAAA